MGHALVRILEVVISSTQFLVGLPLVRISETSIRSNFYAGTMAVDQIVRIALPTKHLSSLLLSPMSLYTAADKL